MHSTFMNNKVKEISSQLLHSNVNAGKWQEVGAVQLDSLRNSALKCDQNVSSRNVSIFLSSAFMHVFQK